MGGVDGAGWRDFADVLDHHNGGQPPTLDDQPRMPVIIEPADWPIWLGETEGDVGALLRPAPEDVLRVWPVDKKVGNVKNDGPELLEPHASSEQCRRGTAWIILGFAKARRRLGGDNDGGKPGT